MQDFFADALARLLDDHGAPTDVRRIEAGGERSVLWRALAEGGFIDALRPERLGGSGLAPQEVFGLLATAGRYGLPLPLAQSMLVRGLIEEAPPVDAVFTIADRCRRGEGDGLHCASVPFGAMADWVVADDGDGVWLLPCADATVQACGHRSLDADITWTAQPARAIRLGRANPWCRLGAGVTAALLAGAMERVLEVTVRYANERVQFGKAIGRFQAIQQPLSVMAEQVVACAMAAQIGLRGDLSENAAAIAKARTSAAVPAVAAIAHAVYGAMGFTEECDLQLYTRRLHEWRRAYGAESYWNRRLGAALLAGEAAPVIESMQRWMTDVPAVRRDQ